MRAICRVAICVAVAGVVAIPCIGWGRDGHRIVGAIAQRFLTPEASAAVFQLLDGDSLADVSTWADDVKAERGEGEYHYINVPRTAKTVDPMRDGRGGRTVLGAIAQQAAILADENAPQDDRVEALKYLVHYVGDVHQPLHVSYSDDRGGNDVSVRYGNGQTNLHGVWDTGLVGTRSSDWEALAKELGDGVAEGDRDRMQAITDPVAWANESLLITRDVYVELPEFGAELGSAYFDRNIARIEDRLVAGGIRLAAMLNEIFPSEAVEAFSESSSSGLGQEQLRTLGRLKNAFQDQEDDLTGAVLAWQGFWESRFNQKAEDLRKEAILAILPVRTPRHLWEIEDVADMLAAAGPDVRQDVLEAAYKMEFLWAIDVAGLPEDVRSFQIGRIANAYATLSMQFALGARARNESPIGDPRIDLTVSTRDPETGTEQSHLTVQYITKFWRIVGDDTKWQTFDEHSSPTTQLLLAGNYVLRCYRRDAAGDLRFGPAKPCVLDGKKRVDLYAPTSN